jgi:hypothetical protein
MLARNIAIPVQPGSKRMRIIAAATFLCALVAAERASASTGKHPFTSSVIRADSCTIQEVNRFRLAPKPDQLVYVEPYAMVIDSQYHALALGRFSVLMQHDGAQWRHIEDEFLIGALVRPDRSIELVRSPIPKDGIAAIRVTALGTNHWGVMILERTEQKNRIKRIWHGHYRGNGWLALDSIPVPVGLEILTTPVSSLINAGEEYSLLLSGSETFYSEHEGRRVEGQRQRPVVIRDLFRQAWFMLLPPYFFGDGELLYSPANGLGAAMLRPTMGVSGLSLFLLQERSSWTDETLVYSARQQGGAGLPIFSWAGADDNAWVTYRTRGRGVRALRNPWSRVVEDFEIDPHAQHVVPIAINQYQRMFWMLSDRDGLSRDGLSSDPIRVVYLNADQPRTAGTLSGFPLVPFYAASMRDRQLIVHGAQQESVDGGIIYSVFVTAAISCGLSALIRD